MGYKRIGNTLAKWDDTAPLVFTLSEKFGPIDARSTVAITVNLCALLEGFSEEFLMHLKDILIEWRNRIKLQTIEFYSECLKSLFSRIIKLQLFNEKVGVIDEAFLLALDTVADEMTENQLKTLKILFLAAPSSPIWAPLLQSEYFPKFKNSKGAHGRTISQILAKALTRSACVQILSRCEQAYDQGTMGIDLFAFVHLAFAVFCRPESYRQIRLGDLIFDTKSNSHFIYILPAKSRVKNPEKIAYKINEPLGILLQKQRQHVVDLYSHLVEPQDIRNLSLFPARRLNEEGSAWLHTYANDNFGMYESALAFNGGYARAIRNLFLSDGLTISSKEPLI